jgi:hypothetical protein
VIKSVSLNQRSDKLLELHVGFGVEKGIDFKVGGKDGMNTVE